MPYPLTPASGVLIKSCACCRPGSMPEVDVPPLFIVPALPPVV